MKNKTQKELNPFTSCDKMKTEKRKMCRRAQYKEGQMTSISLRKAIEKMNIENRENTNKNNNKIY